MKDAEYEDADEVRQQQLDEFAHIDLTFSEFLLINIISRSILINSYVIVSIFSPRWKKQSLLLTEHCIMIILGSLFLTAKLLGPLISTHFIYSPSFTLYNRFYHRSKKNALFKMHFTYNSQLLLP